jgi:predicted ATPase
MHLSFLWINLFIQVKTICELIQGTSEHCQIFIATQDTDMLNEFEPKDVIGNQKCSFFCNQKCSENVRITQFSFINNTTRKSIFS